MVSLVKYEFFGQFFLLISFKFTLFYIFHIQMDRQLISTWHIIFNGSNNRALLKGNYILKITFIYMQLLYFLSIFVPIKWEAFRASKSSYDKNLNSSYTIWLISSSNSSVIFSISGHHYGALSRAGTKYVPIRTSYWI